jgi:predicted dehydrogenase
MFYKPDAYFTDAPWRTQKGGGPALINLIHEIHNLRLLCGDVVEVQAMASNAVRGFEVEETPPPSISVLLRAHWELSWCQIPRPVREVGSRPAKKTKTMPVTPMKTVMLIAGTLGSLAIPTMRMKTYASPAERSWFKPFLTETLAIERENPLLLQLAHFLEVIRGNARPRVTVRDGLQSLQVVEAIASAIQTQQAVRLKTK